MKLFRAGVLISAVIVALLAVGEWAAASPEKIELGLRGKLAVADQTDTFRVWVFFRDRPEIDPVPEDRLPPVDSGYVDEVGSIPGVTPRFVDELLNALSAMATPSSIYEISALPFVSRIHLVPGGCAIPEGCGVPPSTGFGRVDTGLVARTSILSVLAGAGAVVTAIRLKRAYTSSGACLQVG